MVSYCSSSNARSLTNVLIEYSKQNESQTNISFNNKQDWCDGFHFWSIEQTTKKSSSSKRCLDFDDEIGLYLPKLTNGSNQLIKSEIILSKESPLPRKEKSELDISISSQSVSNEQTSFLEENQSLSQRAEQSLFDIHIE